MRQVTLHSDAQINPMSGGARSTPTRRSAGNRNNGLEASWLVTNPYLINRVKIKQ